MRYLATVLIVMGVIAGCRSLSELAPPVDSAAGASVGGGVEPLRRGRRIYITTCAKCHAVTAVDDYTRIKWREILPEMIEESNLDATEAADVTAYIEWAHGRSRPSH